MHDEGLYFGFDCSVTSTGIAMVHGAAGKVIRLVLYTAAPHAKLRGPARLAWLAETAMRWVNDFRGLFSGLPHYAAIEGYAMHAKGRITGLAEWGGCVRMLLARQGIPVLAIAPKTLKLFAAGDGGADKKAMGRALERQRESLPPFSGPRNEDETDAAWLALMLRQRVRWEMGRGAGINPDKLERIKTPKWELATGPGTRLPQPARRRR